MVKLMIMLGIKTLPESGISFINLWNHGVIVTDLHRSQIFFNQNTFSFLVMSFLYERGTNIFSEGTGEVLNAPAWLH